MSPLLLVTIGLIWLLILLLARPRSGLALVAPGLGRDVAAGGVLFLLTLGFFWRINSGDVFQPADGGDLVSFLYPTYRFAAEQIRQWTLPLWNPTLYGGAPFIGDIQAGFLYLPNLLLFILVPNFGYEWMQWLVQGHIYWAGLGVYVLLRTLTFGPDATDSETAQPLSRPAALFGAAAFMFSHPLLIHLGNLNLIAVLSWMPWVLAAYHRSLRAENVRGTLRWAGLAALLFAGGNYAGHAQSTYYIALALIVYTVAVGWPQSADSGRLTAGSKKIFNLQSSIFQSSIFQSFLSLATTGLLTLLLTAPILLPAVELAGYTERSGFVYQDAVAFSLAPAQLIGLITPGFFGNGPGLHWGLWDRVELPYAGVITLLAAIFAFFGHTRQESRRDLWPWLGMAAFGLVVSLGVYGIAHGWLTLLLPGFDQFRAPARATVLWTLAISVLGAAGIERMARGEWRMANGEGRGANGEGRGADDAGVPGPTTQHATRNTQHAILKTGALTLAAGALLGYFALFLTQADPTLFLRASVALLAVILALAFWLGTWGLIRARHSGWLGATGFAVAALALLFFDLSATGAYTDISPDIPTTGYEHPEIVAFLKSDPDAFRIDTRTDIDGLWQPDAAALHGLRDVWGIANPLSLSHWADFLESTGGRDTAAYGRLNVKYVIARDGTPFPDNFDLALDAPGELSLFRNTDFAPVAWVEVELGEQGAGRGGRGTAVVEAYGSNELVLAVDAADAGFVVLSEAWYPGWQAQVNGAPAQVERAYGALRAVAVPPGKSTVRLLFVPASWRWGLGGLAVGMLLLALIFLPRRRPQAPRTGAKRFVK